MTSSKDGELPVLTQRLSRSHSCYWSMLGLVSTTNILLLLNTTEDIAAKTFDAILTLLKVQSPSSLPSTLARGLGVVMAGSVIA